VSNVISGQEAQQILLAIDNEQILPDGLRERLTRLAGNYEHRRIRAEIKAQQR
jgi:hypothetical protein